MFGMMAIAARRQGATLPPVAGSNAARINTALTGFTVPFSVNYPSDPVESSTATVDTSTLAANIVAGRTLTLQAGAYGSPNWNVNDLNVICQSGVSFSGMTFTGDRVRVTGFGGGNTTIGGTITYASGSTDTLLDHATYNLAYFAEDGTLARHAFINCTQRSSDVNWGNVGCNGGADILYARCDLETTNSTYSTMRMVGLVRHVLVNNRLSTGAQQVRFHCTDTNGTFPYSYGYVAGNQFESNGSHAGAQLYMQTNNGGGDGAGLTMSNLTVEDNNFYRNDTDNGHCNIGNDVTANMDAINVTGNRAFCGTTPGTAMGFINGSMPNSTVSDNLTAAFGAGAPAYAYGDT